MNVEFPPIVTTTEVNADPLRLTEAAAARVKELGSDYIRLAVTSGGCSGFQYNFSIDEPPTDSDVVFETDGVKLVIDALSIIHVGGSVVDFKTDVMSSQFVVENPNVKAMCGCGVSFQV